MTNQTSSDGMRNITFGGVLYCGYKRIRGNEALRKVKINISNEYEGDGYIFVHILTIFSTFPQS